MVPTFFALLTILIFCSVKKNQKENIKQQHHKNKVFPKTQYLSRLTNNFEKNISKNCTLILLSISLQSSFHIEHSAEGLAGKPVIYFTGEKRDFMQNISQKPLFRKGERGNQKCPIEVLCNNFPLIYRIFWSKLFMISQ